jgi:hypothetical protein
MLKDKGTLVKLYSYLNSKAFFHSYENETNPFHKLYLSMGLSIGHVAKKNPEAVKLFCMIGMMPGGVIESDEI